MERLPLAMILGTDAFHKAEETNFTRKGVIHFGDRDGKNGEREQAIAEFFDRAGVAYKLEVNMKRSLWYKFMLNVGVNQVTAVLRLPYGAISNMGGPDEIPEARDLINAAVWEVVAVANAEGIDLGEEDVKSWCGTVNVLNPAGFTSMCQDVLAKRKTEVEMFSLTVTELGRKHSIPVPVNETLYRQLRAIERSYHLV
jgi:2-dehydropantoate 2-reductase